jgi:Helix-turn-helix domain
MRSYAHLSEDERDQIGVLRAAGRSIGAIARALGRASHHLPGAAAERTPFGRVLATSRRRSLSIAQAA